MAVQTIPKVTYAAIPTDQLDTLHTHYEDALERVRDQLGQTHSMYIGGQATGSGQPTFDVVSPSNHDLLVGRFPRATREQVSDAIDAAHDAFQTWGCMPYQQRIHILRQAADNFRDHKFEIAAVLSIEAGKSRMEALGEVEEAADLISWYTDELEVNNGFVREMNHLMPGERNVSVLKPYGVWAVIAPFNFPVALATGMIAGALTAGNTVVFKPASATALSGLEVYRMFASSGLPDGALNFITGGGAEVGEELATNLKIEGMAFTGSREVGSEVYKRFSEPYTRPCITEMGGKNPTIITRNADLDKAAEGVMRSAFGYSGQKCSACSRVYVERPVYDEFMRKLVERTSKLRVGEPTEKDVFVGPVINESAVRTYLRATDAARQDGRIYYGGHELREGDFARGTFVEPAVVGDLPVDHWLFKEELFVPFVAAAPVDSLEEALELSNDSVYGLCAGIYSEDTGEVQRFFDEIKAGVTYANRRGGSTTGAWPGCQSFCGWKGSGSTGKGALGPYYLQQFMREQNQTVITETDPDTERVEAKLAGE